MPDFEMHESFSIDNGELDGLTPPMCFVLGVEWQMIVTEAESGNEVSRPIHAENASRAKQIFERRHRKYKLKHMHDDKSESWLWLSAPAVESPE